MKSEDSVDDSVRRSNGSLRHRLLEPRGPEPLEPLQVAVGRRAERVPQLRRRRFRGRGRVGCAARSAIPFAVQMMRNWRRIVLSGLWIRL